MNYRAVTDEERLIVQEAGWGMVEGRDARATESY